MGKRLFLALLALFSVQAIAANQKPTDVPAYVAQTPTFRSGFVALNVLGDGSNSRGGTAPGYVNELSDPNPGLSETGWIDTSTASACGPTFVSGSCQEDKFRTHANGSQILFDDAIRNFNEPGTSHCHLWFGNRTANGRSTLASLRNRPGSNAGGGPLNGTAYWAPCIVKTNPFADGKNYALKLDYGIIYYTGGDLRIANIYSHIPYGLRYVLGVNMDDPDDLGRKAEIATANAQTGTSGRYSYRTNGFHGWVCQVSGTSQTVVAAAQGDDTVHAKWLKSTANVDPWNGTCTSGAQIYAEADAPDCWDGVNLWSPGGYDHLRYSINDSVAGGTTCPNGWYKLPQLVIKLFFTTSGGFSDYGAWRLSSDNAAGTAAGRSFANGESFHTDWLGGWKKTIFTEWQNFCVGVDGNSPHECSDGLISTNRALIRGQTSPDGRSPQVSLTTTYGTASASSMFLLPSTTYTGTRTHATH